MSSVIVVGGGHNGLVCAAYLLRGGKSVTVVEGNDDVGGFASTVEHDGAPGFRGTVAFDHVLTNIPTSVIDELDLARHGHRMVAPDPHYSWLRGDGASIAFYRDQRRTMEEIRRFSPVDAERYGELMNAFTELWWTIIPYLQDHPTRPAPATIAKTLTRAARHRKSLGVAAKIMLSSPGAVLEEWFESEETRAACANFAVGSMAPLDEPSSGFVLSLIALMHRWGVRRSVGGNGAFSDALAAEVRAQGGQIRTGTPVSRILLHGTGARGVELADGTQLLADTVVAAVDPHTLCHGLLGDEQLTPRLRSELRGMGVLRNNVSAFKGDVALEIRPKLPLHSSERELLSSCMMFAPTLDDVRRSTAAISRGELPDDTPIWMSVTSVLDRTLVPEGSQADTIYVYLPSVPFELADGAGWAGVKDKVLEKALDTFELVAPGVRKTVINTSATSPIDLMKISPVHRGNLMHVDQTMAQFGPWRPTTSLSGYKTPWKGRRDDGVDLRLPGVYMGTLENAIAAETAAASGRLPEVTNLYAAIPTGPDPTQAPDGQDTLWLYAHPMPLRPHQPWDSLRAEAGAHAVARAAEFIDGVEEFEIGRAVDTPEDMARRFRVSGGSLWHVDLSLFRLGPFRPARGLSGYRTPIDGFYLGSGGSHPTPGMSGLPGRLASNEILRHRKERTAS